MLANVGTAYYDFRAALMFQNGEGLSKTYNPLYDRHENDLDIAWLRELPTEMDGAVLAEYGWEDVPNQCEFLPNHKSDEDGHSPKWWRY